ncbi:hypothetical protein DFS34DRAFT_122209 [Phlyctochytrium arcticum]|nr:hypothetical protein DFS34DRAFT_122209 [Phlyctochytrium arcticum]
MSSSGQYEVLLSKAHESYRSLSSALDWQPDDKVTGKPVKGLDSYRVFRRPAVSGESFKIVARVLDGPDGISLRPRNFGAVLEAIAGDAFFVQATVIERIDARTSIQHLTKSEVVSPPRDFVVINQTVATSTTFVSLLTSVPTAQQPSNSPPATPPYVRGHLTLLAWVVERAAEWKGLKVTCFVNVDPVKAFGSLEICKEVVVYIPRSVGAAAVHLRTSGFLPYALDYATYVTIVKETYDKGDGVYLLEWTVTDDGSSPELQLAAMGQSAASVTSYSGVPAMVDVRLDYRRWLTPRFGLEINFEELLDVGASGTFEDESQVHEMTSVWIDSEGGWNVSYCNPHRRAGRYILRLKRSPTEATTINGQPLLVRQPGSALSVLSPTSSVTDKLPSPTPASDGDVSDVSSEVTSTTISPVTDANVSPINNQMAVEFHSASTPRIALPLYQHRFSGIVKKSFDLMSDLMLDTTFRSYGTQKSVDISKREVTGHPVGILRGIGRFPLSEVKSIWSIIAVVQSAGARKVWDSNFDDDILLEQVSPCTCLVHALNKGVWPTSARDATVVSTTISGDRRIQTLVASVENDDALPLVKNGQVRAFVDIAGWDIDLQADETVKITHIIQFDPRGWIPGSLINAVSTQLPLTVAAVVDYLKKFGAPPRVLRGLESYSVIKTTYEHDKRQYNLSADRKQLDKDPQRTLDIWIDLDGWGAGSINVSATSGAAELDVRIAKSIDYGSNAVIAQIRSEGQISMAVNKGKPGSGIQVNGKPCEILKEVEIGPLLPSAAAVISSIPIAVPAQKTHSPVGSHVESMDWESPTGRLSMSALMNIPDLNEWASTGNYPETYESKSIPQPDTQPEAAIDTVALNQENESDVARHQLRDLRAIADASLAKLLGLHGSPRDWVSVSSYKSGLNIFKKNVPASGNVAPSVVMKGTKVVEGFSVAEVFQVTKMFGCRKCWDDLLEDGRQLQHCGDSTRITYQTIKGFFPMSRRDTITVSTDAVLGQYPTIASCAASIPETLLSSESRALVTAEAAGKVRATLVIGGWVLEPIDPYDPANQHPIPSTRATYYHQIDLGGVVSQTVYGLLVGGATKHPASVESYLKEHGVPPYVAIPGPPKSRADGQSDRINTKSSDIVITKQDFTHESNNFNIEFKITIPAIPEKEDMVAGGRSRSDDESTRKPVRHGSNLVAFEQDSEDDIEKQPTLLELMVDLSRYPSGYHVKWETFKGSDRPQPNATASCGAGPQLQFEVMEVLPPPTHSALHFPTDGISPGGNDSAGYESGSESTGAAVKLGSAKLTPVRDLYKQKSANDTKITKHIIKIRLSSQNRASGLRTDRSPPRSSIRKESHHAPQIVEGYIRLIPSHPKKVGVTGLWSAAVGGENAFVVTVNDKRMLVGKAGESDTKTGDRERLKRTSRSSLTSGRPSATSGLGNPRPGTDASIAPAVATSSSSTAEPKRLFNGGFLFNRRRPKSMYVAQADAPELKNRSLRVTSMPQTSSEAIRQAIQVGGVDSLRALNAQSGSFHSSSSTKRRASVAGVFLNSHAELYNDIPPMSTPPPLTKDVDIQPQQSGSPESRRRRKSSSSSKAKDALLNVPPSTLNILEPSYGKTYPLLQMVLCGIIFYLIGMLLRLYVVDPFSLPPSSYRAFQRQLQHQSATTPPSPDSHAMCPPCFTAGDTPPVSDSRLIHPAAPAAAETVTVTVTIMATPPLPIAHTVQDVG